MSADDDLHDALRRVAGALDEAAAPVDPRSVVERRPPSSPGPSLLLVAAAAVVALLVAAVAVLALGNGEDESVRTEDPPAPSGPATTAPGTTTSTTPRPTATTVPTEPTGPVTPPSYEGTPWDRLPAQGLAVVEDDRVVLIADDGTELGTFAPDDLYGIGFSPEDRLVIRPGVGMEVVPAAVEQPDLCDAMGGGGVRAAVCGDEGDRLVLLDPSGAKTDLADAPFGGPTARWRWAEPSPDGRWLLAYTSYECEVPHAVLVPLDGGEIRMADGFTDFPEGETGPFPVSSQAVGWTDDGRALVVFEGESGCGTSTPEPGLHLVDPDTGDRTLLRPGNPYRVIRFAAVGGQSDMERAFERARTGLGLEPALGDHGAPGVSAGLVWDGATVAVDGYPLALSPEVPIGDTEVAGVAEDEVDGLPVTTYTRGGAPQLAFTCGDGLWTVGGPASGADPPSAEVVAAVAAALIPRLDCTVGDPPAVAGR